MAETMKEVVDNRIRKAIDNKSLNVKECLEKLEAEGKALVDYIILLGKGKIDLIPKTQFMSNGYVKMSWDMQMQDYNIHDNAICQLGEKFGINVAYLKDRANGTEWEKSLAAHILNEHSLHTDRKRVLVRSVGDTVKGVLSDKYRRLNSVDIVTAYVQEVLGQGGSMYDGYLGETNCWLETIHPETVTIPSIKNGDITMAFGGRISTSDYGKGTLAIRSFMLQGICLNGMVREQIMNERHLGGRLPDDVIFSDRTYQLDTEATVSAVRDITRIIYSPATIKKRMFEIQDATEVEVDMSGEIVKLQKTAKITKDESKGIADILMANKPEHGVQGESTLWKLTQGITAYANVIDNAERTRQLAEVSGELMNRVVKKEQLNLV